MDRVRFGRALGTGARAAARTLISAAEAAAAPDPKAGRGAVSPQRTAQAAAMPRGQASTKPGERAAVEAANRFAANRMSAGELSGRARGLGKSVWNPLAKFSTVLWLEVTGCFFGFFAVLPGTAAWKLRGALHGPFASSSAQRFYLYALMSLLFAYFSVSSFWRARRRQRK